MVTDVYPVRDQHDPRDLLDGYVDSSQEPTGADPLRDDFQQYEHGLDDGTLIDAPGTVVEPDPFDDPMGEPEQTLEPFAPGAEFVTPPIEAPEVAEPFAEEALL